MIEPFIAEMETEVARIGGELLALYATPVRSICDGVVLVKRPVDGDFGENGHEPYVVWRTHVDSFGHLRGFVMPWYYGDESNARKTFNSRVSLIASIYSR